MRDMSTLNTNLSKAVLTQVHVDLDSLLTSEVLDLPDKLTMTKSRTAEAYHEGSDVLVFEVRNIIDNL